MKQNNGSESDGIKATSRAASNTFQEKLSDTIEALGKKKNQDVQIVYLDKNFPPAEIKITIAAINAHKRSSDAQIKTVAIVPETQTPFESFPFSLNFLIQCYVRCLNRDDHLTMKNDDPQRLAKLLVLFYQ